MPHTYGVDDIPVAIQERNFTADNQWDYEKDYNADGVYGDTLVVNGTINPYFDVENQHGSSSVIERFQCAYLYLTVVRHESYDASSR